MKYLATTDEGQTVMFAAGRIGGFEYVGQDNAVLLVSINTSQRSDEVDWVRIGFRTYGKERIEQFAEVGDHLTVVALEREETRGSRTVKKYNAIRYYIGRSHGRPVASQAPAGLAEPTIAV